MIDTDYVSYIIYCLSARFYVKNFILILSKCLSLLTDRYMSYVGYKILTKALRLEFGFNIDTLYLNSMVNFI